MIADFARRPPADAPPPARLDVLTPRETAVLRLIARGLSNAEISDTLVIAGQTARSPADRPLTSTLSSTSIDSMNLDMEAVRRRAAVHAALAEPARLAVVEALLAGDRSPGELAEALGVASNLLAHHLNVLAEAGLVSRARSEADRRRTYLRLVPATLAALVPAAVLAAPRVVFVCTHNSARSQLAAALWSRRSRVAVASAGTDPAARVHRRAVTVARRHGLSLADAGTAHVTDVVATGDLVIAVCDRAYEQLGSDRVRLHWSVPDPVGVGTAAAFERAYADIQARVDRLAPVIRNTDSTAGRVS